MKKILLLAAAAVFFAYSCTDPVKPEDNPGREQEQKQQEQKDEDKYGIDLKAFSKVLASQTVTVPFSGPGILTTSDFMVFKASSSYVAQIESVAAASFTVTLPYYLSSGTYSVSVLSGGTNIPVGSVEMDIAPNDDIIVPDASTTVYGRVLCEGKGIPDVVVSDGLLTAKTDARGVYQLPSAKKQGYVFVSIPSGYTVPVKGVFPQLIQMCVKPSDQPERLDFTLVGDSDQSKHSLLLMGDFQLCRRNNDLEQLKPYWAEMKEFIAANVGKKYIGMTIGDMTWDEYWVSNSFGLPEYVDVMNQLEGMTFFNTIGNHDYELEAAGDMDSVVKYKKFIGPTYYSFNYGKIHYISLDTMVCKNDGKGSRSYDKTVDDDQLQWLDRDLSYVDKSTQIVVICHVNTSGISNFNALLSHFAGFEKPIHFFTAHTHTMKTVDKTSAAIPYFEHNSATPSGALWQTGAVADGINICDDGTPAGYTLLSVDGDKLSWRYKSFGRDVNYQFRAYDRRSIALNSSLIMPQANSSNKSKFDSAASAWADYGTSNKVFINVWNYDPSWLVEVTENGKPLTVTKTSKTDPYYLYIYLGRYYNSTSSVSSGRNASSTGHMFEVNSSSPTSTLEIKVTDGFGNIMRETFTRPKALNEANYPW